MSIRVGIGDIRTMGASTHLRVCILQFFQFSCLSLGWHGVVPDQAPFVLLALDERTKLKDADL